MSILFKDGNGNIGSLIPGVNNIDDTQSSLSTTYSSTKINQLVSAVAADIPTNTSDLINDSDFADTAYVDQQDAAVRSASAVSATATASPVTDAADGLVQSLTIYGKSEVVDGEINSVGAPKWGKVVLDGNVEWGNFGVGSSFYSNSALPKDVKLIDNATVTNFITNALTPSFANALYSGVVNDVIALGWTVSSACVMLNISGITTAEDLKTYLAANPITVVYELADPSQGSPLLAVKSSDSDDVGEIATFTTALPLRGIDDLHDELTVNRSGGQVTTKFGEVDLGTLEWINNTSAGLSTFCANIEQTQFNETYYLAICAKYTNNMRSGWNGLGNGEMCYGRPLLDANHRAVVIRDDSYTDAAAFKAAVAGVKLVYRLAEEAVTPLTAAEAAAFRSLRTFDGTTNITITDDPEFELDYLKNTDNGKAVADVQEEITRFASIIIGVPENHRNIFRGKNLGDYVTSAQESAIINSSFDDLYTGDYWQTDVNTKYRVADMDYLLNCGDTALTAHHLVIVPDNWLLNAPMNDTPTTEGGYVGSKMRSTGGGLEQAATLINAAFPGLVLPHQEYLINVVTNGKASGSAWYDSTVELMNESMVYGHREFTPGCDGTTVPANYTIDKTQLALFQIAPKFITNGAAWWLRNVVSAAYFALVYNAGSTSSDSASYSIGVRPYFLMGKEA